MCVWVRACVRACAYASSSRGNNNRTNHNKNTARRTRSRALSGVCVLFCMGAAAWSHCATEHGKVRSTHTHTHWVIRPSGQIGLETHTHTHSPLICRHRLISTAQKEHSPEARPNDRNALLEIDKGLDWCGVMAMVVLRCGFRCRVNHYLFASHMGQLIMHTAGISAKAVAKTLTSDK